MASTHPNDKQQPGFQTTAQAAAEKLQRQLLGQNVTRGELLHALIQLETKLNGQFEFLLDEVPGLRERFNTRLKEEQAAHEAQQAEVQVVDGVTPNGLYVPTY
jgi:hypothetical protein